MKITVEQTGNPAYPRYILALENGTFFDGTTWTPNKKKALKFASLPVIKDEWKKLQEEMETGLLVLQACIVVTVKGVKELSREQTKQLATFLADASSFTLDYTKPRPKWLEMAAISTQIHWNLKPRK